MPIYVFEDIETGEQHELFYTGDDAPKIGEVVTAQDRTLRRLPSPYQISADVHNIVHKYPYESHSIEEGWSEKGPTGGQVIRSRQHEREIMAKSKDNGKPYVRI